MDQYYMSVQTASNGVRILTLTILSPWKVLVADAWILSHEIAKLEPYLTVQEALSQIYVSHLCLC